MAYEFRVGDPKAACDVCGFIYNHSALRMNWKHQMVCAEDWEPRHPQENVTAPRPNRNPMPSHIVGEMTFLAPGDVTADDL